MGEKHCLLDFNSHLSLLHLRMIGSQIRFFGGGGRMFIIPTIVRINNRKCVFPQFICALTIPLSCLYGKVLWWVEKENIFYSWDPTFIFGERLHLCKIQFSGLILPIHDKCQLIKVFEPIIMTMIAFFFHYKVN